MTTITPTTQDEPSFDRSVDRRSGTIRSLVDRLTGLETHLAGPVVPLLLTIVLLLTSLPNRWYVSTPLIAAVTVAMIWPKVTEHINFWYLVAGTLLAGLHQVWFSADNHHYLVIYWTIGVALSLQTSDPTRSRRRMARQLIGAVFALAFGWKLVSTDFVSGDFIEFTLLTDGRFSWLAVLFGGASPDDLAQNRDLITALAGPNATDSITLIGQSPRLGQLAQIVTWWTLAIEGAIAAAFLLPKASLLGRNRDRLLIAFIISTYVAAPVVGFGWILAILGIAGVEGMGGYRRLGYFTAALLVRFAATPWNDLLIEIVS